MLEEMIAVHMLHLDCGSRLCGLHLEQTGEEVTECVEIDEQGEMFENYRSLCDPRLSGSQAIRLVKNYVACIQSP